MIANNNSKQFHSAAKREDFNPSSRLCVAMQVVHSDTICFDNMDEKSDDNSFSYVEKTEGHSKPHTLEMMMTNQLRGMRIVSRSDLFFCFVFFCVKAWITNFERTTLRPYLKLDDLSYPGKKQTRGSLLNLFVKVQLHNEPMG